MNIVAIIPARSGSKRIPNKNIKLFAGKPIISYSIKAAQDANLFDEIIVSTDSEKIAEVANTYGAEVPFIRPTELANDYVGTNAVILHCLQWLIKKGTAPNYVCCIYATAPFIQPEYIEKGFEIVKDSECTFSFSVTTYAFPIQRSIRIRPDGYVEPIFPESVPKRSQDLEETYHDAGQFYWGKTKSFLDHKCSPMSSPFARPIVLPRYLVQDIDTMEDWEHAELMFKVWQQNKFKEI